MRNLNIDTYFVNFYFDGLPFTLTGNFDLDTHFDREFELVIQF